VYGNKKPHVDFERLRDFDSVLTVTPPLDGQSVFSRLCVSYHFFVSVRKGTRHHITRQNLLCPGCRADFQSPSAFVDHLSNNERCALPNPDNIPIPPAFYQWPGEEIYGRYHPNSGFLYDKGATMLDQMKTDEHKRRREHVVYYPFKDKGEWELGKFLAKNLTQTAINEFLNLSWVGAVLIVFSV